MAKKPTVTTITSGYASNTQLNANFVALRDAFDNTLSLDGSTPNTLTADLDLSNNDLLNVGSINGTSASGLSANLGTVAGISGDITTVAGISADVTQVAADTVAINAASANASAAAVSASAASTSETNAAASQVAAAASYDSFDDRYLGAKASNPTVDNDGDPLLTGALYFNTTSNEMRTWNGSAWVASFVTLAGALIATNNLSDLDNVVTARTNLGLATVASTGAYSDLTGTPTLYADADVDTHLNTGTAVTGEYLSWNGADYDWAVTPDPFSYTTVSGATQALNVGTYNFFDAGTLTADITVSFTNVPTEARWTYTAEVGVINAWDLTAASYVKSFSVASEENGPTGLFFKPDGTAMYVTGSAGDDVNEYSLSTAWNISSASYVKSFSVAAEETSPSDIFFKPDGSAMYIVGLTGQDVNEYSLAAAWSISSASYVQSFSVAAQDTGPNGLFFKPDGTAMYVLGYGLDAVYEYSLSTAWNISTASYVRNFSIATEDLVPTGLFFKPDGTAMYVLGSTGDAVNEYSLSTAWNVSTASYVRNFSVAAQENSPQGLFFKHGGTAMYVLGSTGDAVYEYNTGALASITTPASIQNPPSSSFQFGDLVSYTFFTADAGTTVKLINEEVL